METQTARNLDIASNPTARKLIQEGKTTAGIDWKLEEARRAITIALPTDPGLRLSLTVERVDEVLRVPGGEPLLHIRDPRHG